MEVFQNVHSQVVFEKSLNASFLALIPQKVNAVEVKDFQPISIVGGDLEDYFYGVGSSILKSGTWAYFRYTECICER